MTDSVTAQQAVAGYLDAVRLWRADGGRRAGELIDAAVVCLAAGIAHESVCELAGESADPRALTRDDLEPLVRGTTDELGLSALWDEPVHHAALDVMVRRVLEGAAEPRSLAEWALGTLEWEASTRAQPFVELGSSYDDLGSYYDDLDLSAVGRTATLDDTVRLEAHLFLMESRLEKVADVRREQHAFGVTLTVMPHNPQARSIWLQYLRSEIVLEAGEFGGRWELERTLSDALFLVDVVDSVVAGRVRETLGPQRSCVEITLTDGSKVVETGYRSLLPLPGWRRRGRVVHYGGYARSM